MSVCFRAGSLRPEGLRAIAVDEPLKPIGGTANEHGWLRSVLCQPDRSGSQASAKSFASAFAAVKSIRLIVAALGLNMKSGISRSAA